MKTNSKIELNEEVIVLKNIKKQFGERVVLDDVNFTINRGDFVTIMGESGSGKSTILNILGFLDVESSGEYFFSGIKAKKQKERTYLRNNYMGFVFQSYNLIPRLTVYENIVLPIYYFQASKGVLQNFVDRIPDLLKRFNIENISNSYVEHISGGEKQRVCMARSMVCDAEIIISDEPTGNLDKENAKIVLNEFKKMNEEGKTIIIVTHDSYVESMASKKFRLKEGMVNKYEF